MDPVIAALAAGAAAGLTNATSQAVLDAYAALEAALRERFPQVDVRPLERLPESRAKQASLAEDLARSGAVRDAEVVRLALALLGVVERHAPQAAAMAGVDLGRVRAEYLAVRAPGGPDPNC